LSALEPDQRDIGLTEQLIGRVYIEQGQADDGILLLLSAVEKLGTVIGRGNPDTLEAMKLLADAYRRVGRISEAEATEREIVYRSEQFAQEREVLDVGDMEFEWERREDQHTA
jgi:hypothetical protein